MSINLDGLRSTFSGRLLSDPVDMAPFLTDWGKMRTGKAVAVAQPDATKDVAAIVKWCVANSVPIVPQGGNTGMAGGCIPNASGRSIVLSLTRMNKIRSLDLVNNTMTLDAGCILQNVQKIAADNNRLFPLSLAAEGSCTIGGNLATNAGGTAVLRYGNARDLCLGLEVVTPTGDVWDSLKGLRKDNTAYNLRDLFIGSEGTLGIITGAVINLFALPAARATSIVAVRTMQSAVDLFKLARERLEGSLTGFEFFTEDCVSLVTKTFEQTRRPFDTRGPIYVLVELTGLRSVEAVRASLMELIEAAFEQDLVTDGVVAESLAQSRAFWSLRELIAEAMAKGGKSIKHDLSVPISSIPDFLAETNAAVAASFPDIRFVVFGHLGDGNIHYDFIAAEGGDQDAFYACQDGINRITHDKVREYNGSISAEHGIGTLRRDEADRYRNDVERQLMRTIKSALDPFGLMNPGKVIA